MKELCAQKKYNYKTIMNYIALMKEGKKDFKKPKWAIDIKKLDTIQIERIAQQFPGEAGYNPGLSPLQ